MWKIVDMEAELPKHRSAKEFTCPHQQGSRLEYFGSLRRHKFAKCWKNIFSPC